VGKEYDAGELANTAYALALYYAVATKIT